MFFNTQLTVTINGFLLKTVHGVKTKYDSKHVGSSCDVVVPLNCIMEYTDGSNNFLTQQAIVAFKTGDPILITASYPNTGYDPVTIFQGFVYDFKEGMPVTIRCIDYLPLLGNAQNLHFASVTLQDLITQVIAGTGITLLPTNLQFTLVDLTYINISPWAILEDLKKKLGINISLYGTNLYCNVASNTQDVIIYRTDTNLFESDLQSPESVWQGYQVRAWFLNEDGTRTNLVVGDPGGHMVDVYYYKVAGGATVYNQLANEALLKVRQRRFAGTVAGYLYPDCHLFDQAQYTDLRYPDKNGNYVITELSHEISDAGFHRHMKWSYLLTNINEVEAA